MLNVLFFITGFLICWVITKKPLQIKIHHVNEDVTNSTSKAEMRKIEEEMLKEDPKMDEKYASFEQSMGDVLKEVNDTMGGSDR